jgi:hypothetical protein
MMNVRRTWLPLLLGLACCHHTEPDPFGKLSKEQLAAWTSDCSAQVTDTPTPHDGHDPEAVTVSDREAFATATHRLRCAAEGWTVWLDASDQISGMCTEGIYDRSVNPSIIATGAERGEPVLRRHFPGPVVDEMVHGFCVSKPHQTSRRLLRWDFELPKPRANSHHACCWEVVR